MNYRFLCVDDEKRSLATLKRICLEQNEGNEVHAFNHPSEAILYAQENDVDIALLDIDMPCMNGIQLAKRLLEIKARLNIIFVTAYSEYAYDSYTFHSSGYLLKPITLKALNEQLENLRYPVTNSYPNIEIKCFGNFEIYHNSIPITFSYKKTKELLAILVDRNGASCTNAQISSLLWDDDTIHNEYLKKLKQDLVNTLDKLGISNILNIARGEISINTNLVKCDYFDYLNGKTENLTQEYMEQYSWSEYSKSLFQNN